jgi:molybdopterin-guanine dinucleotide biosynthesis protein A
LSLNVEDVALVILAGGRGVRLGGAIKPLLEREGATLLARIEAELAPIASEVLVVAPKAIADLLPTRAAIVHDAGEGPAAALLAAARATERTWLFVIAGDHTEPSARLFELLAARATADAGAICAVLDGTRQPFGGLYRTKALRALAPEPRARGLSMRALLDALLVVEVGEEMLDGDARRSLADVDTPEDAARSGIAPPPLAPDPEETG